MMMPVLEIDSFTKFFNWMQVHPVGCFGILIGLIVIMAIIHGIESAFMLLVVRPRDPELYHVWFAVLSIIEPGFKARIKRSLFKNQRAGLLFISCSCNTYRVIYY